MHGYVKTYTDLDGDEERKRKEHDDQYQRQDG